jgi:signal transduction histidine kinase
VIPIRDSSGTTSQWLVAVDDITERRLFEYQSAQAQKLESIGQLASGIAHEINTPIQYVGDNGKFLEQAFKELLAALDDPSLPRRGTEFETGASDASLEYLRDEVPKAIEQLLEGVDRVARIVRAMKEFSHPDSTEKTLIDLNRAIESTAVVSRNEWKYVAELETNLDPSLPLVNAFPGEINQVVLNLIVNAAHAIQAVVRDCPGTKGKIAVATRRTGDFAEVSIRDSGTGIPSAIQSRVFDPFFTTKEVGKGTGQGLFIAHTVVVKKHGGTIHFETEEGKGTTFVVRLPLGTGIASA